MADLSFRNIKKVYDGNVVAVHDFNLNIKDKEFVVFVGPSGCGKSTTLRMVAGLESITDGELYIGDTLVNNVAPKDRDIAMVFQNYAPVSYTHLDVYKRQPIMPPTNISTIIRTLSQTVNTAKPSSPIRFIIIILIPSAFIKFVAIKTSIGIPVTTASLIIAKSLNLSHTKLIFRLSERT